MKHLQGWLCEHFVAGADGWRAATLGRVAVRSGRLQGVLADHEHCCSRQQLPLATAVASLSKATAWPLTRALARRKLTPARALCRARSQRLLESTWDDLLARQAAEAQAAEALAVWLAPALPRSQPASPVAQGS